MSDNINTSFETDLYKQDNVPIATFDLVTSFDYNIDKAR